MNVTIRFLAGSRKGEEMSLDKKGIFRFGRDPDCEVHLMEGNVSRQHAQLLWDGVSLVVEDLKSTNGIFLNGLKIDRQILRAGDIIGIGSTVFKVETVPIGSFVDTQKVSIASSSKPSEDPVHIPEASSAAHHAASGTKVFSFTSGLCTWLLGLQNTLTNGSGRLLEQAIETLLDSIPVTRIVLLSSDGKSIGEEMYSSMRSTGKKMPIMADTAQKVIAGNHAILIDEGSQSATLGIPIYSSGNIIAVLLGDNPDNPTQINDLLLDNSDTIGRAFELILQRLSLAKAESAQVKNEQSFLSAKRIQAQLFNRQPPKAMGPLHWAIHYQPMLEIGGDFHAFHESNGTVQWFLGDLAGRGIPAALVMGMLKGLCKALLANRPAPSEFMSAFNEMILGELTQNSFLSGIFVSINPEGVLSYANAGHNYAFITRKNSSSFDLLPLKPAGVPLGVVPLKEFSRKITESSIQLERGDLICLTTDGLVEAQNSHGTPFGRETLAGILNPHNCPNVEQKVTEIFSILLDHQKSAAQADDMTLVLGKY